MSGRRTGASALFQRQRLVAEHRLAIDVAGRRRIEPWCAIRSAVFGDDRVDVLLDLEALVVVLLVRPMLAPTTSRTLRI